MKREKKHTARKIVGGVCLVLVVIFLAALPALSQSGQEEQTHEASILSGTVEKSTLTTALHGGGTLAEEQAQSVAIPSGVKLTGFLVDNGDTVAAGDPIAIVDAVTTLSAMEAVQQTLDTLAGQLETARKETAGDSIKANAGGTVKILYAQAGDSVWDVMLRHGALAVISLDGKMQVELSAETTLTAGETVTVLLEDGAEAEGQVDSNLAGTLTVTLEDEDYTPGQTVQVSGPDGALLGSGTLEIHSPWNACAYSGTVSDLSVAVGETVSAGDTLMKLEDSGHSAAYIRLADQYQTYVEQMQLLNRIYQEGVVTAPCDGVISGVDSDSPQLLENSTTQVLESTQSTATAGMNLSGFGGFQTGTASQSAETAEPADLTEVPIAAVTPQDTMTVTITLDEQDISQAAVGQAAEVAFPAVPGETFSGTVTAVSITGANSGGSSKFSVEVTLERSGTMLPGMTASVAIPLEQTQGLAVPVAALVDMGTQTVIYTGYDQREGTLTDPVAVTIGASDGQTAFIDTGLTEGTTFYYAYYDTLEISDTPDTGRFGFGSR